MTMIGEHGNIKFHFSIDNVQFYVYLYQNNASFTFTEFTGDLVWSKLKLIPDSTDFASLAQNTSVKDLMNISLAVYLFSPALFVRKLGVCFDSGFSISSHSQSICKSPRN